MAVIKDKYILGVIPARAGSKRLPNKNLRLLNGKPLIEHIIKTGLKFRKINELIVTTDSEEIKKVAIASGAHAPFLRPKELAQDNSSTEDAVRHTVLFMESSLGRKVDIIVLLQATCPFTTAGIIDECIDLLLKKDWDTVMTVHEVSCRAEWVGSIDDKGGFQEIISGEKYFKLAGLKEYVPSGNVCVFKRSVLFEQKKIIGKNTGTVIVSPELAVDIDYPIDLKFAEFLARQNSPD